MKNKVSIIIPTYNSERTIEACIRSSKEQSYANIEVIVVDNNSTDATKEIAKKTADKVLNRGPERSAQRNYGAKKSSGNYYLFIDSDMVLSKEVVRDCITELNKSKVKAVVIPETSFGTGFWSECKALERACYLGVPWMEAARFFSKKTFNEFSGYDEKNTGTEDYDLPQRISGKYGQSSISRVKSYIYHDEGHLSLGRTLRKKFYYAQKLSVYTDKKDNKKNFSNQSSILKRYGLFFVRPSLLLMNPRIAFGMLTMKTLEFFFGGLGYISSKFK